MATAAEDDSIEIEMTELIEDMPPEDEDDILSQTSEASLIETIDIEYPKPKLKPTDYETLNGLTKAEKTRLLYVTIGAGLVLITWLAAANYPIHEYFHETGIFNTSAPNNTNFEILDAITCPPPVVLTNCSTSAPCNCDPPHRECPPISLSCRRCPAVYETCSAEKCACDYDYYVEPDEGGDIATEKDLLTFPLVEMINRSVPGSWQRLKTINQILTLTSKWFNLLSPRICNTGIHHIGQGGSVGRSCQVCRERNEWMLCVYRNHITGHAFDRGMKPTDKILTMPSEQWSNDYQRAAYKTGFHGYFSDERTEHDTMPDYSEELKFSHYERARFLHKILSLEYRDANGKKRICQLCNELADDATIKKHIQCIWQRSVKILDILHPDSMDL